MANRIAYCVTPRVSSESRGCTEHNIKIAVSGIEKRVF